MQQGRRVREGSSEAGSRPASGSECEQQGAPRGLRLRPILSRGFPRPGVVSFTFVRSAKIRRVSRNLVSDFGFVEVANRLPCRLSPRDRCQVPKGTSDPERGRADGGERGRRSAPRMGWKRRIRVDRATGSPTSYEVASEASASVEVETQGRCGRYERVGFRAGPHRTGRRVRRYGSCFGIGTDRHVRDRKAPYSLCCGRSGNGSLQRRREEPREGGGASQSSLGVSSFG